MNCELERYRAEQAHAYLERIRRMGSECEALRAQIDDAYYRAEGVGAIDYSAINVSSSPSPDHIPNAVAMLQEWVRDYVSELAAYEGERHEAALSLSLMEDPTEASALRFRYLLGWRWGRVCSEMCYSYDSMMKIRRRALAHYWEVMPRAERDPIPRAI